MKTVALLMALLCFPIVGHAQIYQGLPYFPLESVFTGSSGTGYSLTNTSSAIVFSSNSPTFTVPTTGTWALFSSATVDYNGATLLGARNITLKLRRTNNTPEDVAGALVSTTTQVITALTFTAGDFEIPSVKYSGTAGDVISMFGSINIVPTLGSVQVTNAWILGIRIA